MDCVVKVVNNLNLKIMRIQFLALNCGFEF